MAASACFRETVQLQLKQTPLLDFIHADRRSHWRFAIYLRITPKPTFADDRWQPILTGS